MKAVVLLLLLGSLALLCPHGDAELRVRRALSEEFEGKHVFKQYEVEREFMNQHSKPPTEEQLKALMKTKVENALKTLYKNR